MGVAADVSRFDGRLGAGEPREEARPLEDDVAVLPDERGSIVDLRGDLGPQLGVARKVGHLQYPKRRAQGHKVVPPWRLSLEANALVVVGKAPIIPDSGADEADVGL